MMMMTKNIYICLYIYIYLAFTKNIIVIFALIVYCVKLCKSINFIFVYLIMHISASMYISRLNSNGTKTIWQTQSIIQNFINRHYSPWDNCHNLVASHLSSFLRVCPLFPFQPYKYQPLPPHASPLHNLSIPCAEKKASSTATLFITHHKNSHGWINSSSTPRLWPTSGPLRPGLRCSAQQSLQPWGGHGRMWAAIDRPPWFKEWWWRGEGWLCCRHLQSLLRVGILPGDQPWHKPWLLRRMRREQVKLFQAPFERKATCGLLNNSYRWGSPRATCPKQFSWSEAFHIP